MSLYRTGGGPKEYAYDFAHSLTTRTGQGSQQTDKFDPDNVLTNVTFTKLRWEAASSEMTCTFTVNKACHLKVYVCGTPATVTSKNGATVTGNVGNIKAFMYTTAYVGVEFDADVGNVSATITVPYSAMCQSVVLGVLN